MKAKKSNKLKSKYRLNISGKGVIYADTSIELFWKIVTQKYIKNENTRLDRNKQTKQPSKLD